jgi:hypothetical protein
MLYFIPWVILIVVVIVAVPVAAKLSPGAKRRKAAPAGDDGAEMAAEEAMVEEVADQDGDFAANPDEGTAEPLGDDAFADFK